MKSISRKTLNAVAVGLFLSTLTPALANAEGLDIAAVTAQAEAGDVKAQLRIGEALIYGIEGVAQNIAAGIAWLEQAATQGNVAAKAALGKILLDGYYVDADYDTAERLLGEAALAGNAKAQKTLASALLWGIGLERDPARAASLLEEAADSGDIEALITLGEQLVGGWVLAPDPAKGVRFLEEAIDKGDAKAMVALGSFLLYGKDLEKDLPRALALFEQAAEAGDGRGLQRYGAMMMWAEKDKSLAEEYLVRAGEMGVGAAWATLAEGALWGYLGSRRKFDAYAARATEAGQSAVAVFEAQRLIWGISMRASGPEAIATLEQAAEAGNRDALKFLISLVRDGNLINIRKEPDRAKAYMARFGDLLSDQEKAEYAFSIAVARTRIVANYPALAKEYDSHPEFKSLRFSRELYDANPNFAIYLLQRDLAAKGLYHGALDGLAGQRTLRAVWLECQTLDDTWRCGDTVLHPDVIGALLAR